ncbi:hypothetical protein NDU88_003329 [Pleurodeles waltl]|uniref:Uncharacterized protein n=1 Tax=Pleurodeles waltl TaxID=8319 RepID=A0AAV7NG44_PLEWA|nr:hypothetical protein NDU88_003329 [Pleurodeles waltl]
MNKGHNDIRYWTPHLKLQLTGECEGHRPRWGTVGVGDCIVGAPSAGSIIGTWVPAYQSKKHYAKGRYGPHKRQTPGWSRDINPKELCAGHSNRPSTGQLDVILQEIRESQLAIEQRLGSITAELGILKDNQKKLADRIKQMLPPTYLPKRTVRTQSSTYKSMWKLFKRVEDTEGRSRRNNVCIIGLPEGKEGKDATHYVETWLKTIAKDRLSPHFTIERAHRVPGRTTPMGAPPRPMAAQVLNYRDCDALLQAARIYQYPDYTLEVQRRRASFQTVKKLVRVEGLSYTLLFLA